MTEEIKQVFISYAQEGEAHSAWVRRLAERLIAGGIDVVIDQYVVWPEKGWRMWMSEQLSNSDAVLVVCTEEYRRRFDGNDMVPSTTGRGVRWESQHITQALYDEKFRNLRFIPVIPPTGSESDIPVPLKDYPKFRPGDEFLEDDTNNEGYIALYRLLTNQPAIVAPERGSIRRLPPHASLAAQTPDLLPVTSPKPAEVVFNPYPGLVAFTPERQKFFFGRDEDIPRVTTRLGDGQFVCVIGSSGSGKSSLVAAGVEPALRQRYPDLAYLRFTPKRNPLHQFAETLDRRLPQDRLDVDEIDRRTRIATAFRDDAAAAVRAYTPQLAQATLLFVDQFEELFTQTPEVERAAFKPVFDALAAAKGVMLVLTLRSEFYSRLAEWIRHEALETRLVSLEPIRDEARLRELIRRPASDSHVTIDEAVVTELARQAQAMTGSLPLLALTLHRLFERREPGITSETLKAVGGIAMSVQAAAERVDAFIDAHSARTAACSRLFSALATVVDHVPIRRIAEVAPLRADSDIAVLVEAMRTQGLLADPDDAHVEISHEAVFAHWPRLRDWCQYYAIKLDLRRQAELAAQDWDKARQVDASTPHLSRQSSADLLRWGWGWERQKPAIEALLALFHMEPQTDPDFTDTGIHAWRALETDLREPLRSFLYPEPLRLLDELATDDTPHYRREDIGRRLNAMPDLRRGVGLDAQGLPDIVWESIAPGGLVTLETEPPLQREVEPFRIGRYPVTWAQYRAFVDADDGYGKRRWWKGLKQERGPGDLRWAFDNHPVVNVSWFDAVAFCRWLSARFGLEGEEQIRLPTEWEWQWLAQVGDARRNYPWDNAWNPARANSRDSGVGRTVAVGLYPLGEPAVRRVLDLSGNVREWCLNEYNVPAKVSLGGEASRVLRGGAWGSGPGDCRAARRDYDSPDYRVNFIGFRLCRRSPIDPRDAASLGAEAPSR